MQKRFIQNRRGRRIAVLWEQATLQKGLAFVMHGLSGSKEQDHIQTIAEAFREQGFTVVRFDTTNTFGESDGAYEEATVTNYYEDLEDVIRWAASQSWYQEPFVLSGHSLGAMCSTLFAERYPEKILALAPVSLPVSGQKTLEAMERYASDDLVAWRQTGWQEVPSVDRPGIIKRLPWSHMEDRLRYDLIPDCSKLTMPILFIVGEQDRVTTPEDIRQFFNLLSDRAVFRIIERAPHTFRAPEHVKQLKDFLTDWIRSFSR